MQMNLYSFLEDNASKSPDARSVVYRDGSATYSEIHRLVCKLAFALNQYGVENGDRVVLLLDNSIDYVVSYFAILKVGGVVVALNTETTSQELLYSINNCRAKGIICQSCHLKYLEEIASDFPSLDFVISNGDYDSESCINGKKILSLEGIYSQSAALDANTNVKEDDLAQIIYTSGTTGKPKGVMLTHLNLVSNTNSIVEYLKLTNHDSVMVVLPFFYSYGNSLLLTHFCVGGTLVICEQFVFLNKVLDLMIKERATGFSGVPSSYALLLHRSSIRNLKFESLRYVTCAGGGLPPPTVLQLHEILPEVEIYVMYGQTEASARLSYLKPNMLMEKLGSIGKGIPGVELKVKNENDQEVQPGETGEIVAVGKNVMKGYWEQADATREVLKEDALHTGDLATVDGDGYIYIVGRKSDMIKSGAHRINPKEIEDVLAEHQEIVESAVVGVPDPLLGEAIKSFVVLNHNGQMSEKQVRQFCKANLPAYKVPHQVEFVSSLSKTRSGKIKRNELKAICAVEK